MPSIRRFIPQPGNHCWIAFAWLIPLVALFGPALLPERTFAFRDAAHYYAPLFRYVQAQWSHGLPLWNPLEENGRPLLADPTASVLYPGKLVFALPCGFDFCYELYVVGHVILAGGAAFLAARTLQCRTVPSGLAAVAYAFGGSIFFQYCNVIYLVGAAWLPLGIIALIHLLETAPRRGMVELGMVLAMTVLGGDPETAYLLMLTGFGFLFVLVLTGRAPAKCRQPIVEDRSAVRVRSIRPAGYQVGVESGPTPIGTPSNADRKSGAPFLWRWVLQRVGRLLVAGGLAGGLTAVQVIPTWQWARSSDRAAVDSPVTRRQVPPALEPRVVAPERAIEPGTHQDLIYHFSIGPWRWPELIWPGFGGRLFPIHERWMAAIPAEDAAWTPSLYLGLWPALLGFAGLRLRRGGHSPWQQCLSWWVLGAGCACLGRYGLGWLWNELHHALTAEPSGWWDPIGGLYWLMTKWLPGFAMFRYPAKLWSLTALGISLLAALRLEGWNANDHQRWFRRMLGGGGVLLVVLLVAWLLRHAASSWLATAAPDALFGPLDAAAAWNRLLQGGMHLATALCLSVLWLAPRRLPSRRWSTGILIGTSIELAVAQAWMVPTVPQNLFDATPPKVVQQMGSAHSVSQPNAPPSYLRRPVTGWYPKTWAATSSPNRLEACIRWDRETLRPKYNLDFFCRAIRSTTSFSSADYRAVLRQLDRSQTQDPLLHAALLDALGTDFLIEPAPNFTTAPADRAPFCLIPNANAFPRAWIVHRARRLQPLRRTTWPALIQRTEQVFAAEGQPRNLRQEVIIETDEPLRFEHQPASQRADVPSSETCAIISDEATQVVIEAHLNRPGLVVLRDAFAPGWSCRCRTDDGPWVLKTVLRANRVMRGIALPAGQHQLVFQYRPRTVFWGGLISTLSWLGLLRVAVVWSLRGDGHPIDGGAVNEPGRPTGVRHS